MTAVWIVGYLVIGIMGTVFAMRISDTIRENVKEQNPPAFVAVALWPFFVLMFVLFALSKGIEMLGDKNTE